MSAAALWRRGTAAARLQKKAASRFSAFVLAAHSKPAAVRRGPFAHAQTASQSHRCQSLDRCSRSFVSATVAARN